MYVYVTQSLCHTVVINTGEGNGNPLQCSCLENPRDGGALWASVYAQSQTRLKRLSSSNWSCKLYLNPFRERNWLHFQAFPFDPFLVQTLSLCPIATKKHLQTSR